MKTQKKNEAKNQINSYNLTCILAEVESIRVPRHAQYYAERNGFGHITKYIVLI